MKKQTLFLALFLTLALAGRGQELLPNPPRDYLICISHPIPGIVYVGGLNGLYKSIDDGDTWESVNIYDTNETPFKSIWFFNEQIGLASFSYNPKLGYIYDLQEPQKGLYKTVDGGLSWTLLDTSRYFRNIEYVSEDTVFAIANCTGNYYDGILCRSFNGGLSWEEMDVMGNNISDYSFVSPSIVYAVKGCDHCYITPPYNYIPIVYKSTDWGTSWTTIFSAENFQSKAPIEIDQIHFFEDRDGVLMGHQQIFTEDDFTTFEIANSGYYVSNPGGPYLVIQAKYLNSGYCVAISFDDLDVTRPSTIRLSRDKGHHYIKCNIDNNVYDVSGCETDTTFFVVCSGVGLGAWAQPPSLYRIRDIAFEHIDVEEYDKPVAVSVFPNPVTDHARIICEQPVQMVQVMDVTGRLFDLKDLAVPQTDFCLNTSSWPSGLYLLELLTSKGRTTAKIVKK